MSDRENRPSIESLEMILRELRLSSFLKYHEEIAVKSESQGWSFRQYLYHLAELELSERKTRRIERLRKSSGLPPEKTWGTLELSWLTAKIRRQLPILCDGDFVGRHENVLTFGLPGRGKTHITCAIGHELILRNYKVLFTKTYHLVQRLLRAKRDLTLEKDLRRLDNFDVVILDDIGYVQQERDEMEVLFTFLGERYERRSVMITSNLVFSQWDRIFKDSMTTAAAIDRLVHHATILELTGPSRRNEEALKRRSATNEEEKNE